MVDRSHLEDPVQTLDRCVGLLEKLSDRRLAYLLVQINDEGVQALAERLNVCLVEASQKRLGISDDLAAQTQRTARSDLGVHWNVSGGYFAGSRKSTARYC